MPLEKGLMMQHVQSIISKMKYDNGAQVLELQQHARHKVFRHYCSA